MELKTPAPDLPSPAATIAMGLVEETMIENETTHETEIGIETVTVTVTANESESEIAATTTDHTTAVMIEIAIAIESETGIETGGTTTEDPMATGLTMATAFEGEWDQDQDPVRWVPGAATVAFQAEEGGCTATR